ncbi:Predicted oxidoreductase [Catalinimonas alkaloidigena]|uniref:Predicted oxidoreductase n=1 Tax=Catalinimonas alkaloidigena TaxID=1075417 RepID=A0A1G8ZVR3_9BACT|nr:aldo/keto reductase [Catalinimonas alkaloidigena]SDK19229.1 Predicted oxidoreductase [Catalinimonas alkaloidigena]
MNRATTFQTDFSFPDGLTIRRLGFGAMRLTGKGIWGEPRDREQCKRVLQMALDLGVNFIDTADSYGPNVSEEIIAETLHPYPDGLVIATKGGLERGGPDQWSPNGKPEHLRKALEGSLKRLRVERIDLYQFHMPDPNVPYEDSIGTLVDLQKEGKIRHLGVSNVSVAQLKQARELTTIVTVQNRYNLADRSSEAVMEYCTKEGIGFIPWYPLNTGKLTEDDQLSQIAQKHNAEPSQIALAWLLHRSPIMLPIPGTSSEEHLHENMKATDIELSDEEMKELERL